MINDLTKEELLQLINDRGDLKIVLVADVKQEGFNPYKMIIESDEQLKSDVDLFDLTVISKEYKLLTYDEIKTVNEDGYIPN